MNSHFRHFNQITGQKGNATDEITGYADVKQPGKGMVCRDKPAILSE